MKQQDKSVFYFFRYKAYLESKVGDRSQRSGVKSEMAAALHCQPTYISQVLHGKAQLSLEQADGLNNFFGHTKEESAFFLLLVQKDRAGTISLRRHFEEQMEVLLQKRMTLTERLGKKNELNREDQARYYSSWKFAAVHIAITIPELQTSKALSEHFRLSLKNVNEVLEFLVYTGLAKNMGNGVYQAGSSLTRLGNDSPLIFRHHSNWRQVAMESLDREEIGDLHYSSVISISKKDAIRIKDRILDWLKKDIDLIRTSPEEEVYSYCIDFFNLRQKT